MQNTFMAEAPSKTIITRRYQEVKCGRASLHDLFCLGCSRKHRVYARIGYVRSPCDTCYN